MRGRKQRKGNFLNIILLLILLFMAYWFLLRDENGDLNLTLFDNLISNINSDSNEVNDVETTSEPVGDQTMPPVITLKSDTNTYIVGSNFDPHDYVYVTDNIDSPDEISLMSNFESLINSDFEPYEPKTFYDVHFWATDTNGNVCHMYIDISTIVVDNYTQLYDYIQDEHGGYLEGAIDGKYYSMTATVDKRIDLFYLTPRSYYPDEPFMQYAISLSFQYGEMSTINTSLIRYYKDMTEYTATINGSYFEGEYYYGFSEYTFPNDNTLNHAVTEVGILVNELFDEIKITVYDHINVEMR